MFSLLSLFKNGYTQFQTGYPTIGNPVLTVNSSSIYFMDDFRAHVNTITSLGPSTDVLSIDHIGLPFTVGDHVMIIQMITAPGSTAGFFEEREITGITGGGIYLNITKLGRSYTTSSMTSGARVQVLKIPRFYKLTNKGVIRCKPWNGYTGGVLCFAAEEIWMGGGVFDASATGFGPDNVNWAIKGTPGVGDSYYNGGSGVYQPGIDPPCISPIPDPSNVYLGNLGGYGDPVPSSSYPSAGTATSYSSGSAYDYGSPSYSTFKVVMGSAGYFPSGQNAGAQGQGGGHGGNGGSSNAPTPVAGGSGYSGGNAILGGDAGKGAKGGGIILFKVGVMDNLSTTSNHTTTYQFLLAAGAHGDNGKSGGAGGTPGKGGTGGMGTQIGLNIYHSGGDGAHGDYGIAGSGGDGSNGAKAGTIFIYNRDLASWGCFGTVTPPAVGSINLKSGKGGSGGPKGYTHEPGPNNITLLPTNLTTPYSACIPVDNDTYNKDLCHCDMAMRAFESVTQNSYGNAATVTGSTLIWNYSLNSLLGSGTITYNTTTGEVVTVSNIGGATNKYHCKFYDLQNANYIFNRFSYHHHNMTKNHITLPAQYQSNGGNDFQINFKDDQDLFNAKYVRDNNQRYIYYEHSPNKVMVDTTACNPNDKNNRYGYHPSEGDDSQLDGGTPEDVTFDPADPDSHFGFNLNTPFVQKTNDNQYNISVLGDNTFMVDEIRVDEKIAKTSTKLYLQLIDLSGKVIWYNTISTSEIFKISNMAQGIYVLNIDNRSHKKILIH